MGTGRILQQTDGEPGRCYAGMLETASAMIAASSFVFFPRLIASSEQQRPKVVSLTRFIGQFL